MFVSHTFHPWTWPVSTLVSFAKGSKLRNKKQHSSLKVGRHEPTALCFWRLLLRRNNLANVLASNPSFHKVLNTEKNESLPHWPVHHLEDPKRHFKISPSAELCPTTSFARLVIRYGPSSDKARMLHWPLAVKGMINIFLNGNCSFVVDDKFLIFMAPNSSLNCPNLK